MVIIADPHREGIPVTVDVAPHFNIILLNKIQHGNKPTGKQTIITYFSKASM